VLNGSHERLTQIVGRLGVGSMSANGELLVIVIFFVALGAGGIPSSSAYAEEDCLAAPSGRPPPGSQWHYRTDHHKQRKCWHLRAQGEEGETGTA
jgi:hypothetical protein